jgi:predicted DNA-binding WGR domain protein
MTRSAIMYDRYASASELEARLRELENRSYIKQAMLRRRGLSRTASAIKTAAGKPYLRAEGLTRQAVRDGEASMLYMINPVTNESKYYEMVIAKNPQNVGGYTLIRRWGRLGPRFQEKREHMKNLTVAKAELQRIELSKVKKGYISAFGDYHRAPNGKKLPLGQYPVGLETNAGSWRNQEVIACKPVLLNLKKRLEEAVLDAEQGEVGEDLLQDLERAYALTASLDESMAEELQKKMRAPIERLRGTNRRFKFDPFKIEKELKSVSKYLSLQLSLCAR